MLVVAIKGFGENNLVGRPFPKTKGTTMKLHKIWFTHSGGHRGLYLIYTHNIHIVYMYKFFFFFFFFFN